MSAYHDHLRTAHVVNLSLEENNFNSEDDFSIWKTKLEEDAGCDYVKTCKNKTRKDGTTVGWFHCHRSYHFRKNKTFKNESSKPRCSKSLHTNKIGCACPAQIKFTKENDKVKVLYCNTHLGHEREPARMRINPNIRTSIAGKLADGVGAPRVIADIQKQLSMQEGPLTRLHAFSRVDVYNIKKSFNIHCPIRRHKDDTASVNILVNDLQALNDNPVLLFKNQTEEYEGLNDEDIVLILQTKFQKNMFTKFAKNIVCIDGTHDTNKYKFQLYTLLTLDEWNEGVPVAFCISNREDEAIFRIFFDKIKEAAGIQENFETDIFMSDDAPAFCNAWNKVMGQPKKKLLCHWHIHKNWVTNQSKIKNPAKRELVLASLRSLSEEVDEEKFKKEYNNFLSQLSKDADTSDFASYLNRQYSNKTEAWARCFRKHVLTQTNMHLEAMHRSLKYNFMNGKSCIRLDESIDALLNLVRSKKFDRLRKIVKNTPYKKTKQTRERHSKGLDLSKADNIHMNNGVWLVNEKYVVSVSHTENASVCCKRACEECNICIHMFKCTCTDNVVNYFICKHIHACCIKDSASTNTRAVIHTPVESEYVADDILLTLYRNTDAYNCQNEMLSKHELIYGLLKFKTCELPTSEQQKVIKLQDKIISVYQHINQNETSNVPRGVTVKPSKIIKQSFFPTRKQPQKKETPSLVRVSNKHKEVLQKALQTGAEEVINVNMGDDHQY